MKITYFTNHDSSDVHVWSSSNDNIAQALELNVAEVTRIGDLKKPRTSWIWVKKYLNEALGLRNLIDRDPALLINCARVF